MAAERRIYLDHAATTPLDPRVLEAMLPYLREHWGNPASLYAEAQEARRGLEAARRTIAGILGCRPQEIIVTSGGSESDNLALRGAAYAARRQGRGEQIVTTAIEHHAILHTAERLEQEGFPVTYLGVDSEGLIDLAELEQAVSEETALVSIMHVNNEVGTIEPVQEAARVVKEKSPRTAFHTDAVQAIGMLDVDVGRLGVDMLSLAAHKFYGPKGVGALYVRPRTPFLPQQLGGSQEKNRRAGTENVAGVVGMARATELAYGKFDARNAHYRALRDRLFCGIPERVPYVHVTGPRNLSRRVSNNFSACFEFIEGEAILMALDLAGVAASSGSACTSGSLEPSHVLTAMGVPEDLARGSLRLTVGEDNTLEDMDRVLDVLPGIVSRLRSLSPAWPERQAAGAQG
ncbi:MAG: cysteine desulfurase family protein [Dehalococcoidia bacterium]|nr:cysteine desulfurase family protein [Dehalococcoidia bacterium]